MNKQLNKLLTASLLFFSLFGCKEEGRLDHIDDSAPAPAQVTNVTVHNTSGGAVLKYTVPKDENLLYVLAKYEIQSGVIRENKSSYYKDSLVLEGFGDTRTYDVALYSVGKNEKASEPVPVQVNPTTAPIHMTTKSLRAGFGGVAVDVQNPGKADLAIVLMGDTAGIGYQAPLQTFYTSAERASFNYRGLDTVPCNFSVYLSDRWNNISDTEEATLTPMFEEFIPKNSWVALHLPNDTWEQEFPTWDVPRMWDNEYGEWNGYNLQQITDLPFWFTIDLGRTIVMSRLKLWQFTPDNYLWGNYVPKNFELWGSMNPSPDGNWDNWIPLGKFEMVKPSPGTAITAEDIAFAKQGVDFELTSGSEFAPNPFVPIRYFRFKLLDTFSGPRERDFIMICEIEIYGRIMN